MLALYVSANMSHLYISEVKYITCPWEELVVVRRMASSQPLFDTNQQLEMF